MWLTLAREGAAGADDGWIVEYYDDAIAHSSEDDRALTRFSRRVTALRHAYPILRRSRFFVGVHNAELDVKDVTWVDATGQEKTQDSWADPGERCFGMVLDGRAQPTGIVRPGADATMLLILNAYYDVVVFTLPSVTGGNQWKCLVDTNIPERTDEPLFAPGEQYQVTGRSLLLFVLQSADSGERRRSVR